MSRKRKDFSEAVRMYNQGDSVAKVAESVDTGFGGNRMTESKWRTISNRVIGDVIAAAMIEDPDMDEKKLCRRISAAYPFGERANHPYKIWLSAVKDWLGNRVAKKGETDLPLFGGLTE